MDPARPHPPGPAARTPLGVVGLAGFDLPLAEVIDAAGRSTLDGFELTARPPHFDPDGRAAGSDIDGIRRLLDDAGLRVLAYGSYLGRPGRTGERTCRRGFELARRLGAPRIRVWTERHRGLPDQDAAARWLRRLVEYPEAAGLDIVVERHQGSVTDQAERCAALLRAVGHPRVTLCYQTLDHLPASAAGAQAADAKRLARCSTYMHAKNYRVEDGRLALSAPLDTGAVDLRAVWSELKAGGYAGPVSIEFLDSQDPGPFAERLRHAGRYLRRICG